MRSDADPVVGDAMMEKLSYASLPAPSLAGSQGTLPKQSTHSSVFKALPPTTIDVGPLPASSSSVPSSSPSLGDPGSPTKQGRNYCACRQNERPPLTNEEPLQPGDGASAAHSSPATGATLTAPGLCTRQPQCEDSVTVEQILQVLHANGMVPWPELKRYRSSYREHFYCFCFITRKSNGLEAEPRLTSILPPSESVQGSVSGPSHVSSPASSHPLAQLHWMALVGEIPCLSHSGSSSPLTLDDSSAFTLDDSSALTLDDAVVLGHSLSESVREQTLYFMPLDMPAWVEKLELALTAEAAKGERGHWHWIAREALALNGTETARVTRGDALSLYSYQLVVLRPPKESRYYDLIDAWPGRFTSRLSGAKVTHKPQPGWKALPSRYEPPLPEVKLALSPIKTTVLLTARLRSLGFKYGGEPLLGGEAHAQLFQWYQHAEYFQRLVEHNSPVTWRAIPRPAGLRPLPPAPAGFDALPDRRRMFCAPLSCSPPEVGPSATCSSDARGITELPVANAKIREIPATPVASISGSATASDHVSSIGDSDSNAKVLSHALARSQSDGAPSSATCPDTRLAQIPSTLADLDASKAGAVPGIDVPSSTIATSFRDGRAEELDAAAGHAPAGEEQRESAAQDESLRATSCPLTTAETAAHLSTEISAELSTTLDSAKSVSGADAELPDEHPRAPTPTGLATCARPPRDTYSPDSKSSCFTVEQLVQIHEANGHELDDDVFEKDSLTELSKLHHVCFITGSSSRISCEDRCIVSWTRPFWGDEVVRAVAMMPCFLLTRIF
jgi:hypothetical protein